MVCVLLSMVCVLLSMVCVLLSMVCVLLSMVRAFLGLVSMSDSQWWLVPFMLALARGSVLAFMAQLECVSSSSYYSVCFT